MTKVIAVTDWYVPGFKAGGTVRSLRNLIALLSNDRFAFYVLTRDRDLTDKHPYENVETETWIRVGKADVFYTANTSFSNLHRIIRQLQPDVIYMSSFFSRLTFKILLMRRFGLLTKSQVALAPHGEFSP